MKTCTTFEIDIIPATHADYVTCYIRRITGQRTELFGNIGQTAAEALQRARADLRSARERGDDCVVQGKATIYRTSEFLGNVVKYEVKEYEIENREYVLVLDGWAWHALALAGWHARCMARRTFAYM
jgi:hypothetical protein